MRIAVDAMGGDFAPLEVVRGAVQVASEPGFADEVLLVGDQCAIENALNHTDLALPTSIKVVHASEVIEMHDNPTASVRKKRDSSLVVCGTLVKDGAADAMFSAGNSGAAMVIGVREIGRITGIERPAIAATLPSRKGKTLLLDAGAMVDSSAHNLLQNALLGCVYMRRVLGVENPSIGLLNVGSEPGKGDELSKAAYELLVKSPLNFYGNVEGKDVYEHTVDVIVCDGFVGNVLLKSSEGLAEFIVHTLERGIAELGHEAARIVAPLVKQLFERTDYAETGGAPLLGVNGVSLLAHGRSKAKAIASGIRMSLKAARAGYVTAIREALLEIEAAT